jgi:hypothetical protein
MIPCNKQSTCHRDAAQAGRPRADAKRARITLVELASLDASAGEPSGRARSNGAARTAQFELAEARVAPLSRIRKRAHVDSPSVGSELSVVDTGGS